MLGKNCSECKQPNIYVNVMRFSAYRKVVQEYSALVLALYDQMCCKQIHEIELKLKINPCEIV